MRRRIESVLAYFEVVFRPIERGAFVRGEYLANDTVTLRIAPQDQMKLLQVFSGHVAIEHDARLSAKQTAPAINKTG